MIQKEDEDALVEKNVRSLHALASQNGESIGPNTARSVAFGMALATLKARETERLLRDVFTEDRRERRVAEAAERASIERLTALAPDPDELAVLALSGTISGPQARAILGSARFTSTMDGHLLVTMDLSALLPTTNAEPARLPEEHP